MRQAEQRSWPVDEYDAKGCVTRASCLFALRRARTSAIENEEEPLGPWLASAVVTVSVNGDCKNPFDRGLCPKTRLHLPEAAMRPNSGIFSSQGANRFLVLSAGSMCAGFEQELSAIMNDFSNGHGAQQNQCYPPLDWQADNGSAVS